MEQVFFLTGIIVNILLAIIIAIFIGILLAFGRRLKNLSNQIASIESYLADSWLKIRKLLSLIRS